MAPLRSVEGSATNLRSVTNVAYDPVADTMGWLQLLPGVLAFPRTADGNVAPARTIAGSNTTIGYPFGIAVTPAHIFRNGFE